MDWEFIVQVVAIPIVLLGLGFLLDRTIKRRELAVQYVELAVKILMERPTSDNESLQEWAKKIINIHSEVDLPEDMKTPIISDPLSRWKSGTLRLFVFDDELNPLRARFTLLQNVDGVYAARQSAFSGEEIYYPDYPTEGKFQIRITHEGFKPQVIDIEDIKDNRVILEKE